MPLPRSCIKCGQKFQPEKSRLQKLCKDCFKDVRNANFIKMITHVRGVKLKQIK